MVNDHQGLVVLMLQILPTCNIEICKNGKEHTHARINARIIASNLTFNY